MTSDTEQHENGFEFAGRFYPWRVSDMGKDLMLIDRFSGLPIAEFFEVVDDDHERGRAPILLTLIATSLRAGNPDWTVERITRAVMTLNLGADVEFIAGAPEPEEAGGAGPPAVTQTDAGSPSLSNGSSLSSTPQDASTSPTSSETPA